MRYLHTNDDGSIGIWATVPTRAVRGDGAILLVNGHYTRGGRTLLSGQWKNLPVENIERVIIDPETKEETRQVVSHVKSEPPLLDVGNDQLDIGELLVDSVSGFTIEFPDFERDIRAKLAPAIRDKVKSHRVCEKREIPTDYSFRAAWRDGGNSITHDMAICREITRDRLRKERAPILAAKDIESIKALEAGDVATLDAIAVEKQRLRDITLLPAIDAAKTPDELKAIGLETRALTRVR